MENQTKNSSATKKESGQPAYGDKPWQTPQQNDQKDSQNDDSCGCGSEEGNKEGKSTKRH